MRAGAPRSPLWEEDALAQITFRFEHYAKGVSEDFYRTSKADPGLYFRTKREGDKGKFRTPSLRYTAYTAPYMHNGTLSTLREVVEFYNAGGGENDYAATKTDLIQPLGLSESEIDDLVAFLESLSGERIAMEWPQTPPYAPLDETASAE
jgi:cytochrome c peroxidase